MNNSIERKIEIVNRGTNAVLDVFNIVYKTDPNALVSDQIKSKILTGTLEIRHQGDIIESWIIQKNISNRATIQNSATVQTNTYTAPSSCTISLVHDCVAYKINDMNPVEYILCLGSAPACYGGLWSICTYDVCYSNKIYINPNN